MNISKDRILQFLTDRSRSRLADQAAGERPGQFGTDQDAGLLAKFGIDPTELLGKISRGLGNLL